MLSVKVKLKFGESNLLDNRGIEAVKTAVKPYTLKEKKRGAWDQATSFSGSQSRLLGEVAPQKEKVWGEGRGGGGEATGTQACSVVTEGQNDGSA